jgi:hypothetical protein
MGSILRGASHRSKQGGRSRIHLNASGLPQRVLRKAAAQHADGRDLRLSRRFGVVRRVADRDGVGAFDPKLLEDHFEDVGGRLGFLDVVRTRRHVDKVADARDFEILLELILLGG